MHDVEDDHAFDTFAVSRTIIMRDSAAAAALAGKLIPPDPIRTRRNNRIKTFMRSNAARRL